MDSARETAEGVQSASVTGYALRLEQRKFDDSLLKNIKLPAGFQIRVFARDLGRPRMMAVGPDGTIYVAEQDAGRIRMFAGGAADADLVAAEDLDKPHGLAIHDGYLYVATIKSIYRAPIRPDGSPAKLEPLMRDLPDGGQHPNRTIAFGPDGSLYISVGSTCNSCDEPNREHATMLRAEAGGTRREIFARGLRNTIGFGWHPQTKQLWGMDHGSDWRGNDTPPEELNLIDQGKHYGWPYCYGDRQPDVLNIGGPKGTSKREFCAKTESPVLTYQAHSAPIAMVFYHGDTFPAEYRNDAFVAMRGSWNRNPAVGYKVVRIVFGENGRPERFEDFAVGWLLHEEKAEFGRLAGLAVSATGSLLISEDRNGVIYEITYSGEGSSRE